MQRRGTVYCSVNLTNDCAGFCTEGENCNHGNYRELREEDQG